MQGFAGLSLFSVFLLMALGLSIIFGQMKVINMAHGEFLIAGAYVTVFCSNMVEGTAMMPYYFPIAIVLAFCVTFILGYLVEFGLIRFLYKRPLDTLLATWGCHLLCRSVSAKFLVLAKPLQPCRIGCSGVGRQPITSIFPLMVFSC